MLLWHLGTPTRRQAIAAHVDDEDRAKLEDLGSLLNGLPLKHNDRLRTYVSESGLYALIMRSQKEEAKAVKRWVTKDVFPSIRKTGQYFASGQHNSIWKSVRD